VFFFNNIDIQFNVGGCNFHAVNLIRSKIKRDIPLHSHGINCYEIHFISEGLGTLNVEGTDYSVTPGTLFVTGPLTEHEQLTDPTNPMEEWCIYLRADCNETEKYDDIILKFLSEKFWIGRDEQELLPLFQRLFSELDNRFVGYRITAGLLISEIIVGTTRNYINASVSMGEIFGCASERMSIIIEEYFLYEYRSATLEDLSKRLGLSTRQTQRMIEKYYSSSFSEKKNRARMSAAQLMLSDTSLGLSEISDKLGYSSQEYFNAAFKKYYGISPGRFRKRLT
jgi:AraC-like DNA-binding protein